MADWSFTTSELYCMCLEKFEILEQLGKGAMGKVYLAEYKSNGRLYALKFIKRKHRDTIFEGLSVARKIRHKHLIRFYGYFGEKYEGIYYYISIMEFFQGVDIFEVIISNKNIDNKLPDIISQVISGMSYLHKHGYIHRDIKVENILLNDEGDIKIVDYDFITKQPGCIGKCGTPYYASPETLQKERVDYRTDLWSLGVTIFVMIINYYPFDGDTEIDLFHDIIYRDLDIEEIKKETEHLSPEYNEIIMGLLQKDPYKRMSLEEVSNKLKSIKTKI